MANFRKMISGNVALQKQLQDGIDLVELGRKNGYYDILAELRLIQRARATPTVPSAGEQGARG
ncbi:MAG: hypothetical protein H8E20_12170 [Verrucomicrobia bacterium]|nr:hypothetical protein [Verrucomicrobiota bacterium]